MEKENGLSGYLIHHRLYINNIFTQREKGSEYLRYFDE